MCSLFSYMGRSAPHIFLIVFYLFNSLLGADVIELSNIYKSDIIIPNSIKIKTDEIVIAAKSSIYVFNKSGELKQRIASSDSLRIEGSLTIDKFQNKIVTKSIENGIWYLILIENETLKKVAPHHTVISDIFFQKNGQFIYVCGVHLTKYYEYLQKYDSNTYTPSEFEIEQFRSLFENSTAYSISLYDQNLALIDSIDTYDIKGDQLKSYSNLTYKEMFDIDKENNIYVCHYDTNYRIMKYNVSGQLLYTITGHNTNFNSIKSPLSFNHVERLNRIRGSHSVFNSLKILDDYIVLQFNDNPGSDWDGYIQSDPYWYYDIYDINGVLKNSGKNHFRIYTKDGENILYTLVIEKGMWPFTRSRYFLVPFTINDLLENKVTNEFISQKVIKFKLRP